MRPPGPVRRRARRRAVDALLVVLLLAVVGSVTGVLPFQVERVASDSMTPTIGPGDLLLVQHWGGSPGRRDVVVVPDPTSGETLVKRVVAVGGDTVGIEDGVLVVDGTPVCEAAIDPALMDGVFFGPVEVPEGQLFLLGDNRDASVDSRHFGPVPEADVEGLVQGRVWPSPGPLADERC
ncbi:signal peptidase I [Geodermatophilus sp. SYSU D00815]